jgi:ankyrin repeat protein
LWCRPSPLLALKNGDDGVAMFLLECGAKADFECSTGLTPLIWASRHGKSNQILFLLERGGAVHVDSP